VPGVRCHVDPEGQGPAGHNPGCVKSSQGRQHDPCLPVLLPEPSVPGDPAHPLRISLYLAPAASPDTGNSPVSHTQMAMTVARSIIRWLCRTLRQRASNQTCGWLLASGRLWNSFQYYESAQRDSLPGPQ